MQNLEEIQQVLDDLNTELNQLKKKFQEKTQSIFKKAFIEFFNNNPEVTAIGWRQYTPYFNDGDTCVFSCYASYAWVTNAKDYDLVSFGEYDGDENEDGVWIDDADYGDLNTKLIPPGVAQNIQNLRAILEKIDDDIYLQMFGDHVKVVATREGFEVHEYEHD